LQALPKPYGVVTLHRPENVDTPESLRATLAALAATTRLLPLVFPVHPRTRKSLADNGLWAEICSIPGLVLQEPLAYIDFMALVQGARLVITDSGGIQEETTFLGIPCLTLRESTERPITVSQGSNRLTAMTTLSAAVQSVLAASGAAPTCPPLWDGNTAQRTAATLQRFAANGCRAEGTFAAATQGLCPGVPGRSAANNFMPL
jgi:UDP-N-acetylglucosamine 2-epimerase (non-hydrolysing)